MKPIQRLSVTLAGAALVLTTGAVPVSAQTAVQDACGATTSMPAGNCGPFTAVFGENFNGDNIPKGSFSDCDHNADTPSATCNGLPTGYRSEFWAYPRGWYDTANPKNHSNGNTRTFGGEYRADDTAWVSPSSTGDGQLHVSMYRPTSGDNHVTAIVPKPCAFLGYGKYSERVIVRSVVPGYKMAHLFYGNSELDFPEAGGNFADDAVEGFTHGFAENSVDTGAAWTQWHTYSIEWTPTNVSYFMDGNLVLSTNGNDPDETEWVLQNESALSGAYAAVGSRINIDTTWVKCWKYTP